jgi:type I restriction enzyme S subunit
MTSDLRPYPEYKDSGDNWLGKVPAHWGTTGLGAISLRRSERNRPDLPLLSVLREKGVVLRSSLAEDENHNFIPDDLSNYRVALAGDLVVNKMKAWQGSVGIAPEDGIVSPAYFVFDLSGITKQYAHRLLRCRLYADYFARASDGVRIGQWDLSIDQMKRIPIVLPPTEEQAAIVHYLDVIDRRIRRFVRNRRRLIEVLNEQKQAIINRAVTHGLDPNAPLKPSGIDWLGDVPEHWDVRRLRNVAELRVSNVDKHTKEGEFPVRLCNYTDVYKNLVITADMPFMAATATRDEIEAFRLHVGKTLLMLSIAIPDKHLRQSLSSECRKR